jgi:hypothetical protein
LLQAATNVTKHRKRPREKNDGFIIAELSTSINSVHTADVAKFQHCRILRRIRGERLLGRARCHIAGVPPSCTCSGLVSGLSYASSDLTHSSSKMEIEKDALARAVHPAQCWRRITSHICFKKYFTSISPLSSLPSSFPLPPSLPPSLSFLQQLNAVVGSRMGVPEAASKLKRQVKRRNQGLPFWPLKAFSPNISGIAVLSPYSLRRVPI